MAAENGQLIPSFHTHRSVLDLADCERLPRISKLQNAEESSPKANVRTPRSQLRATIHALKPCSYPHLAPHPKHFGCKIVIDPYHYTELVGSLVLKLVLSILA